MGVSDSVYSVHRGCPSGACKNRKGAYGRKAVLEIVTSDAGITSKDWACGSGKGRARFGFSSCGRWPPLPCAANSRRVVYTLAAAGASSAPHRPPATLNQQARPPQAEAWARCLDSIAPARRILSTSTSTTHLSHHRPSQTPACEPRRCRVAASPPSSPHWSLPPRDHHPAH